MAPLADRPSRGAPRLLVGTNNPGKAREFRALLADCGWEIVLPAEIGLTLEVSETGTSYAENARMKARAFAEASRLAAIADDSGLEVDALGGEPGPLHHTKGWDGADNDDRIRVLLGALEGKPAPFACRYRAVVVVAFPEGGELAGEGACEGVIVTGGRGSGGFGYDPVFLVPGLGRTMAELTFDEKNRISHRARAVAEVCERLRERASGAGL